MQFKYVWHREVLPAKLGLVYNRFALSHLVTAYFALTLVHCIVQIVLQVRGHAIDGTQSMALRNVIDVGNMTAKFAILDSHDFIVICNAIPGQSSDPHPCKRFPGLNISPTNTSMSMQESIENLGKRTLPGEEIRNTMSVILNLRTRQSVVDRSRLPSGSPGVVEVDDTCSQVLAWPAQIVSQAKREAIATVAFQIWLFGISIVAILTESIPHVVAALVTHVLSTVWAAFRIAHTQYVEERYQDLIVDLACHNVDFMPTYWRDTQNNQIPILVLNVASLVGSSILSRKLCKQFGAQSFTRVGGSRRIHHLYLLVLVLFVSLQLTTFFLIASLVLWIEQLFNGPIASLPESHQVIFLGRFIVTVIVILPWLYMGWTGVRREQRRTMAIFLVTSVLLIVTQTEIFISPVYRVTFSTWSFFGTITVVAYILVIMTFLMALVCRYFFGRGLAHFLHVQEVLEECNFTPVYIERGSFVSVRNVAKGEEEEADDQGETLPWDVEGKGVVKKVSLRYQHTNGDAAELPPTPIHSPPPASLSSRVSQTTFRVSNSQDTLRSQVASHEDTDYAPGHQHTRDGATSLSGGCDFGFLPPGLHTNVSTTLHRSSVNTKPFPKSSPPSPLPGHTHSFASVASTGFPSYVTPIQVSTVQRPPKLAISIPDTRRVSY